MISTNKYCLIELPSKNLRLIQIKTGETIHLGKFGSFNSNELINKPFGVTYEIKEDEKLSVVKDGLNSLNKNGNIISIGDKEDNRELVDDPNSQKMSMEDIEKLKKEASSGQDIVEQVIASHASFDKKTVYSQAKYVRRKEQKFLRRFRAHQVGSNEIIEYFLYKDAKRILEFTSESLGLVLSLGNIMPGGIYFVCDDTSGLITGAILERMGCEGTLIVVHEKEHANLDLLKYFDFDEEKIKNCLYCISWVELLYGDEFDDEYKEFKQELSEEELKELKAAKRRQYYIKRRRIKELKLIREIYNEGKGWGLILCTTLDPVSVLNKLILGIAGSGSIVAYSVSRENLSRLYQNALHKDGRVLGSTIMETRALKYQVLPGRTHPEMSSRGFGGSILHCIRVIPSVVTASGQKRRR